MTHEKTELEIMCTSHKTGIINANGEVYPVEGAGEIVLPNQIRLKIHLWFLPLQQNWYLLANLQRIKIVLWLCSLTTV